MALAAVPTRHDAPRTLAGELTRAERAAAGPRKQAADLQERYDSAVAAGRHQEAADLQPQLDAARDELVIAETTVIAFRQALDTRNREEAEHQAAADQARRREEAQVTIAQASDAERLAMDELAAKVDLMWSCCVAARGAFLEAQALEADAGHARRRIWEARVIAGEVESMPGHITSPNTASVLADTDPLIRELVRWTR